jgi:LAO/AO transport system kinase
LTRKYDPEALVAGALAGERASIARLISMVESGGDTAHAAIAKLYPHTGDAYTVGITGAPGAGKSTLTDKLISRIRKDDVEVGVLAIDPSSPFSGGAILGDRVRMQEHATDPGVYIRSMSSRGHLGGLAAATPQAVRVLEGAGCDVVLVETVGVGQAEVEVASLADTTLVLLAPGMGDAIQAVKAGILEIADVFVVNKADRDGAGEAVRDLEIMLKLGPDLEWTPPVVRTSTQTHQGIDDLWEAVERHRKHLESTGQLDDRRRRRILREVEDMVSVRLRQRAADLLERGTLEELADDLVARRVDPYRATAMLMERVSAEGS